MIDGVTCARRRLASRTRTLTRVPPLGPPSWPAPALSAYPNTSPPEPSGPRYSARVALSCERGHAPGQVLHALQELRSVIDDRLRRDLGGRYDRHSAGSVGEPRTLTPAATFNTRRAGSMPVRSEHPNTSPPEPLGPRYSARVALSCERGHAPGQVLHALQELRSAIDDRLRGDLGGRYDRHITGSVGTDKLTVTFTLRAATDADAIRSAGLAAGTLAELLTHNAVAVDLSGVALVVRAQ